MPAAFANPLYSREMYGKRGENPPLPRNCERAPAKFSGDSLEMEAVHWRLKERREGWVQQDFFSVRRVSQETGFAADISHVPTGNGGATMHTMMRRAAALNCFGRMAGVSTLIFVMMAAGVSARAVVVRGRVRDPLGAGVAGAKVQLISGTSVIASARSGADGDYEIRSAQGGRFVVLTSAGTFAVNYGDSFFGGGADVVEHDVTLQPEMVREQVTVTATGLAIPLAQASASVTLIHAEDLFTRAFLLEEMRLVPGVSVVQQGQYGGVTSLFVRGGQSSGNKLLMDGVTAEDVGGTFDFGTVDPVGIATAETLRGPDSVLYGPDAAAGVVSVRTARGSAYKPVMHYSGDAGNFHTWRNAVDVSGARARLDYFGAFARFDSSNALPMDRFHVATSVGNVGLQGPAKTELRLTVRNGVSATGVPQAHDFYAISANGKQSDQDLYIGATIDNHLFEKWHNLVRYYAGRKREEVVTFAPVGERILVFGFPEYFGNTVTIRGANGFSATGRAAINFDGVYPQANLQVSNRDGVQYETDYRFGAHLAVMGGFRYDDARGKFAFPAFGTNNNVERKNYDYTGQVQGDFLTRIFYSAGIGVQKNSLFGTQVTPRLGVAWYLSRPSAVPLRGTKVRFTFAKGEQEPNLSAETGSLYDALLKNNPAAIAQFKVSPIGALESRSYEGGVDQNILGEKLVARATYFHNEFGRQVEFVDSFTLANVFKIPAAIANPLFGAYLNSLAYRASGLEAEVEWRPFTDVFVRAGYTHLDAKVQKSFSGDAVSAGQGTNNPNLPGVAIGSLSPLVGARPFRRPPNSGFAAIVFTREMFSAAVKAAVVSRSDDSTFLSFSDVNGDNTLLLPNRNLDFAYEKIDASLVYQWKPSVAVFAQLNNILGEQHMGPIGYPGLPFNFRVGIKARLGKD